MGFFTRLFSRQEQEKDTDPAGKFLTDFGIPVRNFETMPMSPLDALGVMAVWAACRVLADGVAQVPWKLFQETQDGRRPARDHPLYDLIHSVPSSLQTSYQLRETVVFHAALTGDAVCFLDRVGRTREIREIIPISPHRRRMEVTSSGEKIWRVRGDDGTERVIPPDLIWQVSGPSWDATRGLNVVSLAQRAFRLADVTERMHEKFFSNGAKIAGTYSVEGPLSREQYEFLRTWIKKSFTGDEAFSVAIMDRGAKFMPHQMTGVDAQLIETRKLQIQEIGRAFRVFPIMIGLSEDTTSYNSVEQMFIAHVVHSLDPWYCRIEQSANKYLLTADERKSGMFTKFIPNGLMRGASADRAEFYAKALGSGGHAPWMTQDEVRENEEMNRLGGAASRLPEPANGVTGDGNT